MEEQLSNSIGFQQQVQTNVIVVNVQSSISFGQVVGKQVTLNLAVSHDLAFSQNMGPTIEESVSSNISFGVEASRGEDPSNDILFGQSVVAEKSKGVESDILFGQSVSAQLELNPTASNSIQFGQAVVAYIDDPCNRQEYDPQGAGMPAISFAVATEITLVCGADSITLRNPDLGNTEEVDVDRAINISRGGTVKLVRDSQWPKQTRHTIRIDVMKRVKAQELLDFLKNCLGLLVTYTDYEGRAWSGIILNPDSAVIEHRLDNYSASLNIASTRV